MKIEKIVIVGGGTAGWMTASTLIKMFPEKNITLIESPNIETVGVGESTVGGINNWMQLVGIKDRDFMAECDATYKLSIGFEDFYRKDSGRFHYPFSLSVPTIEMHGDPSISWFLKKILHPETSTGDYAECMSSAMALVTENKFSKNEDGALPKYSYPADAAFQFDATKFGLWLRDNLCLPNGMTHIKANVISTPVNENGIEYLVLDNGQWIDADLFVDCTGFKSLLLGKALEVPFNSFKPIISNNYAWATKIPYEDKERQLVNYTNCTAIENGWTWEIPLWSRMGSGYVYSDRFISHEDALKEFQQTLIKKGYKNVEELEYKHIPMRNGFYDKMWKKNVCAIGLSGCFIEPLESNGLYLTHEFLLYLAQVLERGEENTSQWDIDNFNIQCIERVATFAEFVALHYALSHRTDSEYWRELQTRHWNTNSYIKNIEKTFENINFTSSFYNAILLRSSLRRGTFWANQIEGISWIATGLNYFPMSPSFLAYHHPPVTIEELKDEEVISILEKRKKEWRNIVKNYPSTYQYLKTNIYNG